MVKVKRKLRGPTYALGRRRQFQARMGAARRRAGAPSVYKFKEPYYGPSTAITVAPNSVGTGIVTASIANLTNWTSYKNLFDLYRITGMKVTFMPTANVAQTSVQDPTVSPPGWIVPGGLPWLHIAPNRDPLVPAPTNIQDVLNDDGVRSYRLDRKRSFFLKFPKADVTLPDGLTHIPLLFNNKIQPWLQTGGNSAAVDQSTLKHYGFRYALDCSTIANSYLVNTIVTLYFQLKERD